MSYGLIYTIPFASLNDKVCVVEIEKDGYTGKVLELVGAESPFTVDVDDEEFLYTPSRFSTANIRVVGNDYLQSLFSTSYQQYRVTFKKEGAVTWCGFIKPEIYTQDYSSEIFELELECISALSTLEYIDYKQAGEGARVFISLWDLLKKCIMSSNGLYESVYIPHVYASSESDYNSGVNVLQNMKVSEQNFFDEDDKPMKLKEVLEEICKLLNWTVCDWKGSLYFVDIDHTGEFYKYSADLETKIGSVTPNLLNVQKIGFAGNGHSYDKLTGRNKVIVKTSNYCAGEIFPEENFNKIEKFGPDYELNKSGRVTLKKFYLPKIYRLYRYVRNKDTPLFDKDLDSFREIPNDVLGAMLLKRCEYNIVNGNPDIINYDWSNLIQIRSYRDKDHQIGGGIPILEFASPLPVTSYSDGAISISMAIQITMNVDLTTGYVKQSGWLALNGCQLSIGSWYYNGDEWTEDSKSKFSIEFYLKNYDGGSFINNLNTKTLSMPYNGLNGYIIPLPNGRPLFGSMKFCMGNLGSNYRHSSEHGDNDTANPGFGCFIKDLKMTYQLHDDYTKESDGNSDRYYENIVNESFINELDEIEFKISSYNNDGACYSKVMLGNDYLKDNLYSAIENKLVRPEEHLIRRIIKRYGATHIKLTQVIKETPDLTPLTRLSDNFMVDNRFIVIGGSIDYRMDQFECIMIEV